MSQYSASIPDDGQVKPEIKSYFEKFYQTSDMPDAHESYVHSFTKNATFILGPAVSNGRDQILITRRGMWEKVATRSHTPKQIYAFGKDSDDVMLHGHVEYTLKDGKKANTDWAGRAHLTTEDGELKMDFYQVYLDTTATSRAK